MLLQMLQLPGFKMLLEEQFPASLHKWWKTKELGRDRKRQRVDRQNGGIWMSALITHVMGLHSAAEIASQGKQPG